MAQRKGISREAVERHAGEYERALAAGRNDLKPRLAAEAKAQYEIQAKALGEESAAGLDRTKACGSQDGGTIALAIADAGSIRLAAPRAIRPSAVIRTVSNLRSHAPCWEGRKQSPARGPSLTTERGS